MWFLLSFLFLASSAHAYDFDIVGLNELSLNYRNYAMVNDKARNLLIYPEHPKEGIDVGLNLDLVKYGYMDSQIESLTTSSQYRSIGLQLRLGIRISDYLQVGYWHHSQHVLDRQEEAYDKFPSEDAVEVKVFLYRAKSARESVF